MTEFLGLTTDQWIEVGISAAILVAATLLVRWLFRHFLDFILTRLFADTGRQLSSTLLLPLRRPLIYLFIVIALQLVLFRLNFLVSDEAEAELRDVFFVLYVIEGTVVLWRLISNLIKWYGEELASHKESEFDKQILPFVSRILMIVIITISGIILLSHFDIDVTGLVTTLGIGSLAIALAAQESLADMISGIVIMMDRPYRINDRIEINELDAWGDVLDIGLRSTRIRTRDNRMVIVPNSLMSKNMIVNYSYPDDRYRIEIEVGVAYGTDIELARRTIIEAVRHIEGVLTDKPVEVLFLRFGDSAMILRIRWWLSSFEDTWRMFDRVNTSLLQALTEANIEMPFPIREIHHKFDESLATQLAKV